MKRKAIVIIAAAALSLAGCASAADTASYNLSQAAENFEVPRRIVGVNGITDSVLFSVEGFCSYEIVGDAYEVICKQPDGTVERTTMGKSDNVTMLVTQIGGVKADKFHSRVIFRPETIVPNFDLSTSVDG